jgi:hypothetical protein
MTTRTYRLARWWRKNEWPRRHGLVGVWGDNDQVWLGAPRDGTHFVEFIGIYRGRAWPRFWLVRVEVAG